jgi:hypothetical protein
MQPEKNLQANIPAVLLSAAEKTAAAQHISMDELTRAAVRRYLDEMSGIKEQRVDGITHELRDEEAEGDKAESQLFEERLRLFHDWVNSHGGNAVVLPDEAMERESIYGDHGG